MKFGIFFEHQLPRPWREGEELKLFQDAIECARLADQVGFGYAWAQEHHFLEEYSHSTANDVFLAAVSQQTKQMRMGLGVSLTIPKYNHPARVAERVATLDLVSGGRVEWGTGESTSRIELEGFDVHYMEKRAMWGEAIREIPKMMCSTPYAGFKGKYFSMPPRNVVPKPVQQPHPPLWIACTNRDTMKLAARLGMGALTFAFMDAGEAKYWVEEYYETFRRECVPIGRAVNPNIAMLTGLMCHRDSDTARKLGEEGQRFFAYALAHYYRFGTHVPGRTSIWEEFKRTPPEPIAGLGGVGSPDEIRRHFEELESAGVDQLICLQQAAGYRHEDICASLDLFGRIVLPDFEARHEARERKKREELAPYVEKALSKVPPLKELTNLPQIDSYSKLWEQGKLVDTTLLRTKRQLGGNVYWRMNVGGLGRHKGQEEA